MALLRRCQSSEEVLFYNTPQMPYLAEICTHFLKVAPKEVFKLDLQGNPKIEKKRKKAVNFILSKGVLFKLRKETQILAAYLLDFYLCKKMKRQIINIKESEESFVQSSTQDSIRLDLNFESCAAVCLFIASKFNEIHWPSIKDLTPCQSIGQLLSLEGDILTSIGFKVPFPSYWPFLCAVESLFVDGNFHKDFLFRRLVNGIMQNKVFRENPVILICSFYQELFETHYVE